MKKTEVRCPSCNCNRKWLCIEDTTLGGDYILRCNYCGYKWKSIYSLPLIEDTRHSPLELKEHVQYLKDGTKLTNQDKYDLQIDLWLYGKEKIE